MKQKRKKEGFNLIKILDYFNSRFLYYIEISNLVLSSPAKIKFIENYIKRITNLKPFEEMTENERDQLSLDIYQKVWLNETEIGKFYERQVGRYYEKHGFDVYYNGIKHTFEDLGIDLICQNKYRYILLQAKCWSNKILIREKHIFQLYGAKKYYSHLIKEPMEEIEAVFVTTNNFSKDAKDAAKVLKMELKTMPLLKNDPLIKCNISKRNGYSFYFLPYDKDYDSIKIEINKKERFVHTVAEAEKLGFRKPYISKKSKIAS